MVIFKNFQDLYYKHEYMFLFNDNYKGHEDKILDIMNNIIKHNDIIFSNEPILLHYLALYYRYINYDEWSVEYYFKESIEKTNNAYSMYELALYYILINKLDESEKYFIMAIDLGYTNFYKDMVIMFSDYRRLKYGKIAIEKGITSCAYYVGKYYENNGDFALAKSYYQYAYNEGDDIALEKLNELKIK